MSIISAIFAIDECGGMGNDNKLPWPVIPEDFAWFKKQTLNKVVVMGYKTWESLPLKPLPGRVNVVLSTRVDNIPGAEVFDDFEKVLDKYNTFPEIMIIGGAETIRTLRRYVDRVYVTNIKTVNLADVQVEGTWEDWDLRFHDSFTSDKCDFNIWEKTIHDEELTFYTKQGLRPEPKELKQL